MIVRDMLNTRPPELLASWLDALGTFDQLTPHEAAAIWNVPVREALERLHAMVGGPLEIPAGSIETYRRAPWTPTPARPRLSEYDPRAIRNQRMEMIPDTGITISQAAELWGTSPKSTGKMSQKMVIAGDLRRVRVTNRLTVFYRAGSKRRRE